MPRGDSQSNSINDTGQTIPGSPLDDGLEQAIWAGTFGLRAIGSELTDHCEMDREDGYGKKGYRLVEGGTMGYWAG